MSGSLFFNFFEVCGHILGILSRLGSMRAFDFVEVLRVFYSVHPDISSLENILSYTNVFSGVQSDLIFRVFQLCIGFFQRPGLKLFLVVLNTPVIGFFNLAFNAFCHLGALLSGVFSTGSMIYLGDLPLGFVLPVFLIVCGMAFAPVKIILKLFI